MRSRHAISFIATAGVVLGGGGAPSYAVSAEFGGSAITVKVGQAEALSHIEFDGAQPRSARREGEDLVLQFDAAAPPSLALLKVDPPRYLTTAAVRQNAAGVELRLTLEPGVEAKLGRADGGAYVNLSPGATTPAPPDEGPQRKSDPVPATGIVKVHAGLQNGTLSLRFDWRTLPGAAVFRRGEAIWIVFDAHARLDLSEVPDSLPQATRIEVIASQDATALRILAPAAIQASASVQGASWTVALGASASTAPSPVIVKPDGGGLSAQMAGATGVFWLNDPSVGDRLAVVTALGPAKGVAAARRLVDADIFSSAQGLAISPLVPDIAVVADQDVVRLNRPSGLQLSSAVSPIAPAAALTGLPQPAAFPGLVDFDGWSKTGDQSFLARYNALLQAASTEGAPETVDRGAAPSKAASTSARMGFARFLVGSQLSFEAIGVLDLLAKKVPIVLSTAEFRGLRGAARVMAGRYKDAQADFSSPAVADDPASALWRGYAAAKLGDASGARQDFATGRIVLDRFAPDWRARFRLAEGEAALIAGDKAAAGAALTAADALKPTGVEADRLKLDLGRLAMATGQPAQAMTLFASAQASSSGGVAAQALLYATEAQQAKGAITPTAELAVMNSLRFRWRGDETELEAARALGRLYVAQGRYREALEALKSAGGVSADLSGAGAVQGDLAADFRSLFIEGGADGLPPIQALGLFFDFKDLTPVGADGDAMVRKLARRLVDVDLLDQAASLLKYQADNRLDGVARAQVDTDLALIQVMNHQPQAALDALNASRTTLLPTTLQSQRRVIEARALGALGRYDDALEILADDRSPDAASARAEVVWLKRDWPLAGKAMEVALGDRFKFPAELSALEETELLRAAVAYSLAGDDAGLARLRSRYGKQVDAAKAPNMLKVALAGIQDTAAYGQASGPNTFTAWVAAMKARLLTSGLAQA